METKTATYKLFKQIKDDKFDIEDIQHYNLSLQVGIRDLQLCIIDTRDNRCLALEDYFLGKITTYSQLLENLKTLFDDHHLLKAGFWKTVKISLKNNKFTFIPESLFDKNSLETYLAANCKVDPESESFLYYKHIKSKSVNIFALNDKITNWVTGLYPNATVIHCHQASTLIEGVLRIKNNTGNNIVYLYIDRFKLHILTTRNNELEYYNQFPIRKFEDYLKYIMMVMQGLNYKQTDTHVVIWGYLGKQSPHFNQFSKYIKNISFGDRPKYLTYSYFFDDVQDHQYFDLYSTYLCD